MTHLHVGMEKGRRPILGLVACLSVSLLEVGRQPVAPTVAVPTPTTPVAIPVSLPIQGGSYGTIKGRLIWGGDKAPAPLSPKNATSDQTVCGAKAPMPDDSLVVDAKTLGVRDGIAWIAKPKGTNPEALKALLAKTPVVVFDQKNCTYVPHVLAIHQDQKVKFTSSDPVNHNVHLTGFINTGFNEVVPPNGAIEKALKAENPVLKIECNIHGWMSASLKVLDHPFFAVTGDDGSFEITGVPAGTQNLVIWHPSGFVLKELGRGRPLEIVAGQVTDVGNIKLDPAKFNVK